MVATARIAGARVTPLLRVLLFASGECEDGTCPVSMGCRGYMPLKCLFSLGVRGPIVSLTQASLPRKRHLDPFSRFCRARVHKQQTDTQADRATTSAACI